MRIDKIYMHRVYDQWRGKPLYVEDEVDRYGYYMYIPDITMDRGSVNVIMAEFEDSNGATYSVGCNVVNDKERIIHFNIPTEILSNKGTYKLVITISYNSSDTEPYMERSAIQTFKVVDTITSNDEQIKQNENYPILLQMIKELSEYKVDTSNFPTYEEMEQMINSSLEGVSIESILIVLNQKGYITNTQLEKILINFVRRADLADYAKASDLKGYVAYTEFYKTKTDVDSIKNSLTTYVKKEEGKGLSTHDLTDELYNKLISLTGGDAEISQELLDKINASISRTEVEQNYYDKTTIDTKISSIDVEVTANEIPYEGSKTVKNVLDELTYVKPRIISFSSNVNEVYSIGQSISPLTLKWKLEGNITSITISGLQDTDINVNSNSETYIYEASITSTKNITLTVSDGINTDSRQISIYFVKPFYSGTSNVKAVSFEDLNITSTVVDIRRQQTFTVTTNDSIPFFAIPYEYGTLYDIKDMHGFSYRTSMSLRMVDINGSDYHVYLLSDKIKISNMKYTIYFNEQAGDM